MLVKILGFLDILVLIGILLIHFGIFWWKIPVLITIYFSFKLIMFHSNFLSWIDFFIGLYSWIIFFGMNSFFDYIIILFLLQKSISSLI